ncbi:hypothetical protein H072_5796 [Dactylellina haptotyla CBS 200.50]|uniref:RRM domain-containing protein n=1 Tax=Dactylellina haptotyla (strain CBS 200.50) TaxID=1284197 RepID=S8BYI4_DACHA|nr:hypothetical protein H072_5796 [Dactylellina haptotyla CBS 200.50]
MSAAAAAAAPPTTNLDRSLDEILDDKKKARRNTKKAGPVGGVRKRSARIENKRKAAPAAPAAPAKKADNKKEKTDTKIQVSNLPLDVNESMLREYFTSIVGPIKKCNLVYKANGQSAGIATLEFNKPGHANVAFDQFNGRLVDNRPMKVEIIVDPSKVPLADRISGAPKAAPRAAAKPTPKSAANKPKPVTAANGRTNGAAGRGNARNARGRGGRKGASGSGTKRTPKTVEELDQEMADYYKGTENSAPAAATTAVEAAVMEDLISEMQSMSKITAFAMVALAAHAFAETTMRHTNRYHNTTSALSHSVKTTAETSMQMSKAPTHTTGSFNPTVQAFEGTPTDPFDFGGMEMTDTTMMDMGNMPTTMATMTSMTSMATETMMSTDDTAMMTSTTDSVEFTRTANAPKKSQQPSTEMPPSEMNGNFTSRLGPLRDVEVKCMNMMAEKMSGASFDDVMKYVSEAKMNQYPEINMYGCHQVDCVGNYGILKLCNFKEKSAGIMFEGSDVQMILMKLLDMWHPDYMADNVMGMLNLDMPVMNGCGRWMMEKGMMGHGKDEHRMPGNKKKTISSHNPMATEVSMARRDNHEHQDGKDEKQDKEGKDEQKKYKSGNHKHNKDIKVYQNHMEDNGMGGRDHMDMEMMKWGRKNDTIVGIVMNAMMGWALAIDSPAKGAKCKAEQNFQGDECDDPEAKDCTWDYSMPMEM